MAIRHVRATSRGGSQTLTLSASCRHACPYSFCADCAVCADGYARGVLSSCHECSTETRRWVVALATAVLALAILVVIMVVARTIRRERGEGSNGCSRIYMCCHKFLARGIPLSAIKIVVVVVQIITQVCASIMIAQNVVSPPEPTFFSESIVG